MQNELAVRRDHVLTMILMGAVIQGWSLCALHWSLENRAWPADDAGWLFTCYALALLAPLTAQLFAAASMQRS